MIRFIWLVTYLLAMALVAHATPPELCGDGIDNDSSGGDLPCPGVDTDNDRYRDKSVGGADCDDNSPSGWRIYPGVWVGGTDPYDYKQCDPLPADGGGGTGEYVNVEESATSSSNYFTNPGSVNSWYIDCNGAGDDGNAGSSPSTAYNTFAPLHRTTGGNPIQADEAVILFCSTGTSCTCTWSPLTDDATSLIPIRVTDSTAGNPIVIRGYPGHDVTLDANCNSGTPCEGISIFYSDNVIISDLTITGAYGRGIWVQGSDNVITERLLVYDNRGGDNTNVDGNGIYYQSVDSGGQIKNSILHDNHKATSSGVNIQNSANIVSVNSDVSVSDVTMWCETNTLATTSCGRNLFIKWNDVSSSGTQALTNVRAANGYNADFWFSGPVTAKGLLSINPGDSSFRFEDGGDTNSEIGGSIVYSTSVGAATPLFVKTDDADSLHGINVFKNNILEQGDSTYGIIRMSRFDATNLDAYLTDFIDGTNQLDENCYYDAASLSFELAASDGGATYTSLATWQGADYIGGGEWAPDANSFNEDPNLSTAYIAQSSNCSGFGWNQNVDYLDGPIHKDFISTIISQYY